MDPQLQVASNGQVLEYVRSQCVDPAGADLLKERWESFWTNDYLKLKEQHQEILANHISIERLERENRALMREVTELKREVTRLYRRQGQPKRDPEKEKISRENSGLRNTITKLRCQRDSLQALLSARMASAKPSGRDAIQIVPPFVTLPNDRCVIARKVRILSQDLGRDISEEKHNGSTATATA